MPGAFPHTPLVLIILDGWGDRKSKENNGIEMARKPFFDRLKSVYAVTQIAASGPAVGLPPGIMGNSEVGHMNIGAGRIVYSSLSQLFKAMQDGTFFSNAAFLKATQQVVAAGSTLHVLGLLSDGAVHSHQDHIHALLKLAHTQGVKDVAVHCFMDGRDTAPTDGVKYLRLLLTEMDRLGLGRVASVSGRYFAMDRDQRWERTKLAFEAICASSPLRVAEPLKYLTECYARGVGDEFIPPAVVVAQAPGAGGGGAGEGGGAAHDLPVGVSPHDAMVFMNFRADRARQISHAFVDLDFTAFDRAGQALPKVFVTAAPYDKTLAVPVAFTSTYPQGVLGEILAKRGLKQLRLAETEKYAHVTFFLNGGRDVVFRGEERVLVQSPKDVPTYDLKPEMSAHQVAEECLKRLRDSDVIVMNFANADMVGHTARSDAIVRAVETVDTCLARIVPEILQAGGTALITADHGNAEEMVDDQGAPLTSHTTNLVPFILVADDLKGAALRPGGRLCDIAPTILKLLGITPPAEMTGTSLL